MGMVLWSIESVPIKVTGMNPMRKSLWSIEGVPIKMTWFVCCDQILSKWMKSMRFEWIEVSRTIWGEMSDLKDLMRSTLWESPYGQKKVNPIRVTWVNLMGKSLWVENECPYQFDLIDLSEKVPMFSWMNVPIKVTWVNLMGISLWSSESVPIKVTWCEWKWVSLSKWMESMRFELE